MIGKDIEEIEKNNGFCWYVEFKPEKMFGFDLNEHNRLMEVFIEFLSNGNFKILRLNDGNIEEVSELNYEEVLENVKLLGNENGKFYDKELEISYSILTDYFLVIIQKGMIFWSSKKDLAFKWAEKLKENDLNFFEPRLIADKEEGLWENKTKINGVWIDDKTGEIIGGK